MVITLIQENANAKEKLFIKEFLLWGLVEYKKLDKQESDGGYQFEDRIMGSFYNN